MHEVVEVATSDAPPMRHSVDDIVAGGRRRQRRQRAGWIASGTAGLAVLAVAAVTGLPALTARGGSERQTAAQAPATGKAATGRTATGKAATGTAATAPQPFTEPAQPFTFTFGAFDAGPFHVADPIVASNAYQIASIHMTGRVTNDKPVDPATVPRRSAKTPGTTAKAPGTIYAYLTVYVPGAFDPARLKGAKSLTVGGHPARQVSGGPSGINHRLLAWQYATGAWAVAESFSSSESSPSAHDLTALVGGLSASPAKPATVPFTMGYVPAGYQAVEIGSHAMSGLNGIAAAGEGDFGGAVLAKPAPATTGLTTPYGGVDGADVPHSFQIFVTPSQNSNQQLKGKAPVEPRCLATLCNRWSADGKVQIQVYGGQTLPRSEMIKVV
jgi:hypothetical protein